jgi:hypothetical protein
MSTDVANGTATEGAYYAEAANFALTSINVQYSRSLWTGTTTVNTRNEMGMRTDACHTYGGIGSVGTVASPPVEIAVGVFAKYGVSFSETEGLYQPNINGTASSDGTFSNYSKTTALHFGNTSDGDQQSVSLLRNLQRWDLAYADAKAKIDELMGP